MDSNYSGDVPRWGGRLSSYHSAKDTDRNCPIKFGEAALVLGLVSGEELSTDARDSLRSAKVQFLHLSRIGLALHTDFASMKRSTVDSMCLSIASVIPG